MIIATLLPPTWTGTFFDTTNSTVLLRRVYVLPKTSETLPFRHNDRALRTEVLSELLKINSQYY